VCHHRGLSSAHSSYLRDRCSTEVTEPIALGLENIRMRRTRLLTGKRRKEAEPADREGKTVNGGMASAVGPTRKRGWQSSPFRRS
jgi:hypothetical protein